GIAPAGELLLARQRPRTGEHDRTRRGPIFRHRHWARSAARPHRGPGHLGSGFGCECGGHAVRHYGRLRTADHHRHAGEVRLEPDRSGGTLPRPALHPESENQTAGHRDQEEELVAIADPLLSEANVGTAAPGCSRGRSPATFLSARYGQRNTKRAAVAWTTEGGCPYV